MIITPPSRYITPNNYVPVFHLLKNISGIKIAVISNVQGRVRVGLKGVSISMTSLYSARFIKDCLWSELYDN
jgi:hypothetical protein